MTSSSAHLPQQSIPHNVVFLAPRRRVRQYVGNLLALAAIQEGSAGGLMRLIADANATFGDEVIAEILRAIHRDVGDAEQGITLFRLIATPAARTALWSLAQDPFWPTGVQTDALWALSQLGEAVDTSALPDTTTPPRRSATSQGML